MLGPVPNPLLDFFSHRHTHWSRSSQFNWYICSHYGFLLHPSQRFICKSKYLLHIQWSLMGCSSFPTVTVTFCWLASSGTEQWPYHHSLSPFPMNIHKGIKKKKKSLPRFTTSTFMWAAWFMGSPTSMNCCMKIKKHLASWKQSFRLLLSGYFSCPLSFPCPFASQAWHRFSYLQLCWDCTLSNMHLKQQFHLLDPQRCLVR